MTSVLSRALPPPINWQDFERLSFDVYKRIWKTNDAEMHGRTGQPQHGVDVYGRDRVEDKFVGVQCKGKDEGYGAALSKAELLAEVNKAKSFVPKLDVFIVATTAPNDSAIQEEARLLSEKHSAKGLFEVRVQGWQTLRQHISDHNDILQKHFRDLAPPEGGAQLEQSVARDGEHTRAELVRMKDELLAAISEKQSDDDPLQIEIIATAKAVDDGSPQTALRGLQRLWSKEGARASPRNRFRLRANIGNALFRLDRRDEAIAEFRAAYAEDPTWPNAKAFLATAELIEGRCVKAFNLAKEVLNEDPTSHQAVTVLLDAAPSDASLNELEGLIPTALKERFDVNLGLSLRARKTGQVADAQRFSRKAFELAPDDWRTLSSLAETLIEPIFDIEGLALTHQIPNELQAQFDEALNLLRSAWSKLQERDDVFLGAHLAANLISALDIAGLDAEAELVLDAGLRAAPKFAPLLRRYSRRMVSNDDWPAAAKAIDAISADDLEPPDKLLKIQALIHTGKSEDALALAQALTLEFTDLRNKEFAAAMAVEAAGSDAKLAAVLAQQCSDFPQSIIVRAAGIAVLDRGSPDRARLAAEIDSLAASATGAGDRFHAAEALYSVREFAKAANLYRGLHGTDQPNPALHKRLKALLLADMRREARQLFDSLTPQLQATPEYSDIGVPIYDRSGLLDRARDLLERTFAQGGEDLTRRLHWINICERLGEMEEVDRWLESVPASQKGRPVDLIQLALAIDRRLGDLKALDLGYRALRNGYGDPQIHLGYTTGLFFMGRAAKDGMPTPAAVTIDTAVILSDEAGDKTLARVIESEPEPEITRDEIAPNHALAGRLLGLVVGDSIEVPNLGQDPTRYVVKQILDKRLHAHFRSIENFERQFPENNAFGSFTIDESKGDDRFKPIFDSARRRAEHAKRLEEAYATGSVPLALIGRLSGSPFDVWDAFHANPDISFQVCVGVEPEFAQASADLAERRTAVLDPITLYGLVQLKLADHVRAAFDVVGVVQATIDLLRQCVAERGGRIGSRQSALMWDGEHYRMVEVSEADIAAHVATAKAALVLAESLTLLPAEGSANISAEARELFKGLHEAFLDTAIAAQHGDRLLLSDDRSLRAMAASMLGVHAVWTQPSLKQAGQDGQLTPTDYRDDVVTLAEAGYRFTMFGEVEIVRAAETANWEINARVQSLLDLLAAPNNDSDSVQRCLTGLIVGAWRSAPHRSDFRNLFRAVVAAFRKAQPSLDVPGMLQLAFNRTQDLLRSLVRQSHLKRRLLETTFRVPLAAFNTEFDEPVATFSEAIADELGRALDEGSPS